MRRTPWSSPGCSPTWRLRGALCRLQREGSLTGEASREAGARIAELWETVHVVGLTDALKVSAKRLLGVHPLPAADALQLAAALAAAGDDPAGLGFVCLDQRLREAAVREGLLVLP